MDEKYLSNIFHLLQLNKYKNRSKIIVKNTFSLANE